MNKHTTEQAAKLIPCASNTLRTSRVTGSLFGKPAPQFIKIGRSVFYTEETIEKWLNDNCQIFNNTAQAKEQVQ